MGQLVRRKEQCGIEQRNAIGVDGQGGVMLDMDFPDSRGGVGALPVEAELEKAADGGGGFLGKSGELGGYDLAGLMAGDKGVEVFGHARQRGENVFEVVFGEFGARALGPRDCVPFRTLKEGTFTVDEGLANLPGVKKVICFGYITSRI